MLFESMSPVSTATVSTSHNHEPRSNMKPLVNVLNKSKSPYLLQHKDNPVAWQEYTSSTINKARQLNKPIFLSSGYSACHWCHVLAHESFEDDQMARLLNDSFVCIKVDREERPDVDRLYMTYLQATTGSGGWPMSVFLTPNLEPFFAGTYFPKGRFRSLLMRIHELWEDEREQCIAMGQAAVASLREMSGKGSSRVPGTLDEIISTCPEGKIYSQLIRQYDRRYGGFTPSGATSTGPKFPSCSNTLEPLARLSSFLLQPEGSSGSEDVQRISRQMAIRMLRGMWKGGIHDWVGGGVARYSTDEKWIVPHFEKMLYDQAQMISCALDFALIPNLNGEHCQPTDQELCYDLAADILEYSIRDLLSPEGGFWSAEDADSALQLGSKKSEGAFYIWDKREFDQALGFDNSNGNGNGNDAEVLGYFFGVNIDGNVDPQRDPHGEMTGMNILHQARSYEEVSQRFGISIDDVRDLVREGCKKLKDKRDQRERPGLDDKILTSWNGLMLSALAKGSTTLPTYHPIQGKCISIAEGVVRFLREEMWDDKQRTLTRSWRQGKGANGQTDDYAFLIRGLLDLYEATGDESHALWAIELQERQDELFWDDGKNGGYFASGQDENVLVRMKDAQDSAEPSATSTSIHNLSKLSLIHSNEYEKYESRAEKTYLSISEEIKQTPRVLGYTVCALMDLQRGHREIIIIGTFENENTKKFISLARRTYSPNQLIIRINPDNLPFALGQKNHVIKSLIENILSGKEGLHEEVSMRICQGGVCGAPMNTIQQVEKFFDLS